MDQDTQLGQAVELPHNPTTGRPYTGRNVLPLALAEVERGWSGGQWAGFHQWRQLGRVVRKGERSPVRVLLVTERKDGTKGVRMVAVFHRAQTDEMTPQG
jgi:antirestriction protein ArdC